jgi:hypothetical protein
VAYLFHLQREVISPGIQTQLTHSICGANRLFQERRQDTTLASLPCSLLFTVMLICSSSAGMELGLSLSNTAFAERLYLHFTDAENEAQRD